LESRFDTFIFWLFCSPVSVPLSPISALRSHSRTDSGSGSEGEVCRALAKAVHVFGTVQLSRRWWWTGLLLFALRSLRLNGKRFWAFRPARDRLVTITGATLAWAPRIFSIAQQTSGGRGRFCGCTLCPSNGRDGFCWAWVRLSAFYFPFCGFSRFFTLGRKTLHDVSCLFMEYPHAGEQRVLGH
jgi:hypothetical protein